MILVSFGHDLGMILQLFQKSNLPGLKKYIIGHEEFKNDDPEPPNPLKQLKQTQNKLFVLFVCMLWATHFNLVLMTFQILNETCTLTKN